MKKVIINRSAVEKIRSFFPWVYKNEIRKFPKNISPGELVEIYSPDGIFLGTGYINPKSVISVRVLSFFERADINEDFFKRKIKRAFNKREKIRSVTDSYRLIHSEADFIPGLIVDVYGDYLSVQINTAGIENFRDTIIKTLIDLLNPEGIYEKSDKKSREKEGLKTEEKILYGDIPEKIIIEEYSTKFVIKLKESQKTGFYLDQRRNRKVVSDYSERGFKVLDLFSNTGGFGIYCGKKGASFIKFVDISERAVNLIEENCKINHIENFQIVKYDVFDFLKEEVKKGEKYDLIIIDPPSFAKTKKEKEGALRGFKYLILNSLKLLNENGYISVFSCSHHVSIEDLKKITLEVSRDIKVPVEIVEHLYQDKDHPYILNIPNSLYLSGFLFRKIVI